MKHFIKMVIDRIVYIVHKLILDSKTSKLKKELAKEQEEAQNAVKEANDSYVDFMDEYRKRKNRNKNR